MEENPNVSLDAPGSLDRVEKSRLFNDLKPGRVVTVLNHSALRVYGVPEQATVIAAPVHPRCACCFPFG
jgi:predicted methyltransferase